MDCRCYDVYYLVNYEDLQVSVLRSQSVGNVFTYTLNGAVFYRNAEGIVQSASTNIESCCT